MSGENQRWTAWLDAASRPIRFYPDRAAVRAELEAHLEDKTADLLRIFPDMPQEEAERRALEEMGDGAALGKELAKVHRPWLGYVWTASKVALGLGLALLAVELVLAAGVAWDLLWP